MSKSKKLTFNSTKKNGEIILHAVSSLSHTQYTAVCVVFCTLFKTVFPVHQKINTFSRNERSRKALPNNAAVGKYPPKT